MQHDLRLTKTVAEIDEENYVEVRDFVDILVTSFSRVVKAITELWRDVNIFKGNVDLTEVNENADGRKVDGYVSHRLNVLPTDDSVRGTVAIVDYRRTAERV